MSIQLLSSSINNNKPEIVVNSTKISVEQNTAQIFEFVLDLSLRVAGCNYISSVSQHTVSRIDNFANKLKGDLFELNHVRVDPRLNNELILHRFKKTLQKSGVEIKNPPDEILMAICYKPIGELSDIVRFYLNEDSYLVFLSNAVKLFLV
ncbi:MAG: hypothetical protein KBD64_04625 [Gammaproteobacteria bacterium]|nr:hypothetical protein [Gammaproteobacteria bacterium]